MANRSFLSLILAGILYSAGSMAAPPPFDPFFWLEEVEGEHSLRWVGEQNTRTGGALEADPAYASLFADIEAIYKADDDIAYGSFYDGFFWNFWQDKNNEHGLIRRTSYDEYKKEKPNWEIILDLDALSQVENENWIYKGASRLSKTSSRRLLKLSRGGKDAVVVREFDYATRQFVTDGFNVAEGKHSITPLDENTVLIGTAFTPESRTASGYARTLKLWTRGQPLESATEVFSVGAGDLSVGAAKIREGTRHHVIFTRAIDFYHSESFLWSDDRQSMAKLPLPDTASLLDIRGGHIYALLKNDHAIANGVLRQNSVVRFPLSATTLDGAETIFQAGPQQSIEDVTVNMDRVYVTILDNIRSRVLDIRRAEGGPWNATTLPMPTTGIISYGPKDEEDPRDFTVMSYTDHLTPYSQYRVHDEDGSYRLEVLKSSPHRFDNSRFESVQHFATSADGTSVPYFVIKPKDLVLDGSAPTILYGYGGFETSLTPDYSATIGKAWLERGGVYVIANIRGGGEFGPEWHQAALMHNRHKAYEDFAAVAEDLIAQGITSPRHLGIEGGSNGGLLVAATMVRRPELFNAVLSQVPLADMLRFSKLLAGHSWISEYGDPENPADCAYLLSYSPFHNLKPGARYPVPMFTTSTKDDRVHPAHARKMAARMQEQGHDYYYYENINGGHAGSANLTESVHMAALEYSYFWQRLR